MTSFEVISLCAGYNSSAVLKEVSFSVAPGTVTAITGLNGSGKSTLLKCMANLLKPFSGECRFDGIPVHSIRPAKLARKIAFCTQTHPDCGYLTVRELVEMGRFSCRESRSATRAAAEYAMELTGVIQSADRKMQELSSGIQQRVWLALALSQQPELLLLDEPSNFLDPAGRYYLSELLRNLQQKENLTIVLVTHDLDFVLRTSDFSAALKDGKLLMHGETSKTLDRAAIKEIYGIDYQVLSPIL
jgi:iron complex transport system ATP-binding protein